MTEQEGKNRVCGVKCSCTVDAVALPHQQKGQNFQVFPSNSHARTVRYAEQRRMMEWERIEG
jgi:hypothetical protein